MNMRDFQNQVIDYIKVTDEIITEQGAELSSLKKTASENKPAFSETQVEKTVKLLVDSNLLSKEASDVMVSSFNSSPDEALKCMQKIAGELVKKQTQQPVTHMVGTPSVHKEASTKVEKGSLASDKQFLADFGLS